ncbi:MULTISPECIES: M23 family metallopeptidase [unclassified Streptomyces]|uniref:M23 family metallopeptidase n=1 Tax=unclassified Streptomyces TaxID=2593676 RepID=UPI000F6E1644|nr:MULTISPECIES: M23 family metallopeptidase [unclassified Streptomyces]AZM61632.1 peptidase [Streptomyces sp. WAC 01438]RSN01317.1 peptidase [Streptomyces sp. WAC 01420]
MDNEPTGDGAAQPEDRPEERTPEARTPDTRAPAPEASAAEASDSQASDSEASGKGKDGRRRRRGTGVFTVVVLPAAVTLAGVFAFVSMAGIFDTAAPQGQSETAVSNVDGSYVPWLRKATEDCKGIGPALLAAHIDQLSGWSDDGASLSRQGLARFTEADWKKWGGDDDGNGTSSPQDAADAIMALGRRDCALAEDVTALRTKGRISGSVADLTLAAYAVGTDEVTKAGKVPKAARSFVADVKDRLPQYESLVRRNPEKQDGRVSTALLQPPVTTLTVTSPFGTREHPLTGVTKLHTGVDFNAPQGAQVSATREGRVTFAGRTSAYGIRVVIDHGAIDGKRLETTYSHLSALQVTTGQSVVVGQAVGLVGSTGLSTGPHLHFEVLLDGEYTNPVPWLTQPQN